MCCLVVHHTGHAHKNRARGSTALNAGIDIGFLVEREEGSNKAMLKCTKMKDAGEPEPMWFEGQTVELKPMKEGGKDNSSLVMLASEAPVKEVKSDLKGKALELFELILTEGPNVERETVYELAISEGIYDARKAVGQAIYRLKNKGVIQEFENKLTAEEEIL